MCGSYEDDNTDVNDYDDEVYETDVVAADESEWLTRVRDAQRDDREAAELEVVKAEGGNEIDAILAALADRHPAFAR